MWRIRRGDRVNRQPHMAIGNFIEAIVGLAKFNQSSFMALLAYPATEPQSPRSSLCALSGLCPRVDWSAMSAQSGGFIFATHYRPPELRPGSRLWHFTQVNGLS
jgi:hypothetical protein